MESLIQAIMREKMKFERPWIMRASKGAQGLRDVLRNVRALEGQARRGLAKDVYLALGEYLEIVVPEIERFEFSHRLTLEDGINVMDLTGMSFQLRSLVIQSTMDHVANRMRNVVVIIPEAWEYIPQGRGTPVKLYAESFIRKGAAIGNYLWIDGQDVAGVDKTPLKQCNNWIMGRQRESNEVERVRDHLGKRNVSAEEIQKLQLGHFIAAIGDDLRRVYVLPTGVPEEMGRRVALGELSVEVVQDYMAKLAEGDEEMYREMYEQAQVEIGELKKTVSDLSTQLQDLRSNQPEKELNTNALEARIRILEAEKIKLEKRLEELGKKGVLNALEIETQKKEIDAARRDYEIIQSLRQTLRELIGPIEPQVAQTPELNVVIDADAVMTMVDQRLAQILREAPQSRVVTIDLSEASREIIRDDFTATIAKKIRELTPEPKKAAIIVRERKTIKSSELYYMVRGKTAGRIPVNFYNTVKKMEDAQLVTYTKNTGLVSWSLDDFVDGKLIDLYDEQTREQVKEYLASLLLPSAE